MHCECTMQVYTVMWMSSNAVWQASHHHDHHRGNSINSISTSFTVYLGHAPRSLRVMAVERTISPSFNDANPFKLAQSH